MRNAKNKERLNAAFALRPIESLTVDTWADQYRFLAPSVASMPGKFQTSHIEAARGPMRAITEPGVKTITLKTCTQLMKTTLVENLLGYTIHQRPSPILCVFPKVDSVKAFSKERFAAMVRATPVLKEMLGEVTKDRSEQSLSYKEFPGGFVAFESAGSPTNLAARPIRITVGDEIDKMEDLKFEGDPLMLLEERTSTFSPDDLHVRCCSPTTEETSRIEKSYKESDQRRAFVACPQCQHEQTWDFFKHVHWQKSEDGKDHFPLTATLNCESCGFPFEEDQRRKLITTQGAIRWKQTRPFRCCGVDQDPMTTRNWEWDDANQVGYATCSECKKRAVTNKHAGFTVSKLYSPFITVPTLAENWIAAKDDSTSKQVFYNTALGQAFSAHAGKRVETHMLAGRREQFPSELPKEILRLTAGVDDQIDRLEVHVVGWSVDQAWSVHYEIIKGDPKNLETWERLDELLRSRFPSAWGFEMPIMATCIDSGGLHTEMCYGFCQPKANRNIWAVKGSSWSRRGDPVWPVPQSTKFRRRSDLGYKPHVIAVDSAKDYLRDMLLTDELGPGYFHIPMERSNAWLDQLTAEQPIYETHGGVTRRKWQLRAPNRRNEAFDTLVYAYAALCGLRAVRRLNLAKVAAEMPARVATYLGANK